MTKAKLPRVVLFLGLLLPALSATAAQKALPLVIEVESSKGLRAGDAVTSGDSRIGEVTGVGFGEKDTVDVQVRIAAGHRDDIRRGATFLVVEGTKEKRPRIEYHVIDPQSPPAADGERFSAVRSLAEVWLKRGRISADELNRSLEQGIDAFRRNLDELRRSEEWDRFKDQLAGLSAQLAATGSQLSQILNDQLPKLQKELDDLYEQYRRELEKRPKPAPGAP